MNEKSTKDADAQVHDNAQFTASKVIAVVLRPVYVLIELLNLLESAQVRGL